MPRTDASARPADTPRESNSRRGGGTRLACAPMPAADLARAERLLAEQRYAQALEACRAALAEDPGNLDAEHLLACVLVEAGRAPMAAMMLLHVVAARPGEARYR